MKIRAGLILLAALVLSAASAKANSVPVDPEVDVGGSSFSTPIFQSSFSFIVNVDTFPCTLGFGSFDCFAVLNQNQNWTSLSLTFPSSFIGNVTCNALAFFSGCSVVGNTVFFFGGTGIPLNGDFVIGVNNFPAGTQLDVQANVPEPGTVGLFLAGIGALVARRKLHKR